MVVNKPSGLLTTAARGVDSLEVQLHHFLQDRDAERPFVGLPHRIDRPVSGAVLVGKTPSATKLFCAQFQARSIAKTYIAVLEGVMERKTGRWEDWMRKLPDQAHAEIVPSQHPDAKFAALEFSRLAEGENCGLVEIQLETGRTHQIRLQSATRGHPVLGDRQYGGQESFGSQSDNSRKRSIALHAWRIGFRHPKNGKAIEVTVPVGSNWRELNQKISLPDEMFVG